MPVKIILRTDQSVNLFRDILIATACSNIGDKIMICSGFFQKRKNYSVELENNFIDRFYLTKKSIITIGIHNYTWKNDYKAFVNEFRNKGIKIDAYLYTKYHWHSKVYLLYDKNNPILGIIGSSNMTRNAFSTSSPFNVESDVVLWIENKDITDIINEQLTNIEIKNVYTLDYNNEQNKNITINDRLEYLHNNIMDLHNRFTPI
jgi:phosphatidylserine/phosphatidylglycerophosphate/cardiolipin synthase-like enzyme